jgi:hypothetical protein
VTEIEGTVPSQWYYDLKVKLQAAEAALAEADKLVSELHDLMYDVPLPEQATETHRSKASNAVWAIHEVLRGTAKKERRDRLSF